MAKELGKNLSRNSIWKIAHKMYITRHAYDRIAERNTELHSDDWEEQLRKVRLAVVNCLYGFSNNDGSVTIVLNNGQTLIFFYDDEYKRWQLVTFKDKSNNGFTPNEKRIISQCRPSFKYRNTKKTLKMTDRDRFKESHKERKKYKRDRSWKGKFYE